MRKKKMNDLTAGGLLLLLLIITTHILTNFFVSGSSDTSNHDDTVFVQISGDIQSPGIYGFREPPDLQRIVNRAGGLISNTQNPLPKNTARYPCGSRVDLRSDEGMVRIYKSEMRAAYKVTLGIPISLNREPVEGLTTVPGFGPRIAGAIVRERSKRGGFEHLDELLSVPGIGPRLFRKVSRYLAL
jgi:competence protein ComEA